MVGGCVAVGTTVLRHQARLAYCLPLVAPEQCGNVNWSKISFLVEYFLHTFSKCSDRPGSRVRRARRFRIGRVIRISLEVKPFQFMFPLDIIAAVAGKQASIMCVSGLVIAGPLIARDCVMGKD